MMTYRLSLRGVIRLSDGSHITRADVLGWAQYQAWLRAGNAPEPMAAADPPPLAERQARAWQAIKDRRDQVKAGGVLVAGKWFHSDEASRVQQLGLVMMGAGLPAVQWKTMDGSFITMTPTIAQGIFSATAALDMEAFAVAETHKAGMVAAEDPAAYDFTAGWPATYGG